jgi:hypothetical protein
MAFCGISLSVSLSGVKRTCLFAVHMSAFDPKADIAYRCASICYAVIGVVPMLFSGMVACTGEISSK